MKGFTRGAAVAAVLLLASSIPANAQRLHARVVVGPRPFVYAPSYEPYYWYARPYYGYPYAVGYGDVRTQITPKQAEVYVDGFYAGTAGDFDGVFKRLHLMPGGHAITLYLPGYRTITHDVYVRPDSTVKVSDTMERLASGQASTPPPEPMRRSMPRQSRG
jgi:PEGA domain-containing protein